jgi:hypothetical protein
VSRVARRRQRVINQLMWRFLDSNDLVEMLQIVGALDNIGAFEETGAVN